MSAVRRIVGVGASAGGIEALIRLVRGLPADLPAAVLVVLHIPPTGRSVLPLILGRQSPVPVVAAEDGAPVRAGCVMVAPPDCHLLVADGRIRLERGPKENGVRPAVDPMLCSVAAAAGPLGVAVILSGALGDGANGAAAVAAAGGTVVVQDPADAIVPSMPERALEAVGGVARVLPALQIGQELARLADAGPAISREEDPTMDNGETTLQLSRERPGGSPTGFTCPDCGGALWAIPDPSRRPRYRCRSGHQYSEDTLLGQQAERVEAAPWTALDVLEERAELLERSRGAADAMRRAELLRDALAAAAHAPDALDVDAGDLAG